MALGKVKWYDPTKGYGFITPEGGGRDVFVHVSALRSARIQELQEDDALEYEVETDKRSGKPCAVNLNPL